MLTKAILFALLATCGIRSDAGSDPDDLEREPPDDPQEDQHFCCADATTSKPLTGEGCVPIGKEHIATCNTVLYCGGDWVMKDGKVTCV